MGVYKSESDRKRYERGLEKLEEDFDVGVMALKVEEIQKLVLNKKDAVHFNEQLTIVDQKLEQDQDPASDRTLLGVGAHTLQNITALRLETEDLSSNYISFHKDQSLPFPKWKPQLYLAQPSAKKTPTGPAAYDYSHRRQVSHAQMLSLNQEESRLEWENSNIHETPGRGQEKIGESRRSPANVPQISLESEE